MFDGKTNDGVWCLAKHYMAVLAPCQRKDLSERSDTQIRQRVNGRFAQQIEKV